jgi:hypothetical protein
MTHISTRRAPVLGAALTALTVATTLAAFPTAARAQDPGPPAGYFSTVYRAWTFSGCAQGTVIARPENVVGDVVCAMGVATWGQAASGGQWQLMLNFNQSSNPVLLFPPGVSSANSFVSFLYSGPGCAGQCSGSETPSLMTSGSAATVAATVPLVGALAGTGVMDPTTFDLTGIGLAYFYLPPGGAGSEWGVLLQATPTVVPEPGTLSLTAGALASLAVGTLGRRRRGGGRSGRAA